MNKTSRRAFSLVEMLVVIVIVAMLSVLMAPAVNSIMRGTALTSGADKVVAVFSLARQKALTKNHAVEVRFYQYADSGTPGETTAASGKYRAIQVFDIDDNGKATPLGKCESMPTSIIMDSGATLSTLIGSVTNKIR